MIITVSWLGTHPPYHCVTEVYSLTCSSVSSSFAEVYSLMCSSVSYSFTEVYSFKCSSVSSSFAEVYSLTCSSVSSSFTEVTGSTSTRLFHRCVKGLQFQVLFCSPLSYRGLQFQLLFCSLLCYMITGLWVVCFTVVLQKFTGSTSVRLFHLCVTEGYRFKCSSISPPCYRALQPQELVCFTAVLQRVTGSSARLFRRCDTQGYRFNTCSSVSSLCYSGLQVEVLFCSPLWYRRLHAVSWLCYRGLRVQQMLVCFTVALHRVIGSVCTRLFHLCVTKPYRFKC